MNSKQARELQEGDVLAGSGFHVLANAYRLTRTPRGKVCVLGYYPGSPAKVHLFNGSTRMSTS